MDLEILHPNARYLAIAVVLDLCIGDPVYPLHPVRLIGRLLTVLEQFLRKVGWDGYGGGIALFVLLASVWVAVPTFLLSFSFPKGAIEVFLVYSLLALHDLLRHAWKVERAAQLNDLPEARAAIERLVGRDTSRMDIAACRRAAIESISENLTDGWVSALFWYALGGLPALLLFKVVSTMDSMVGYKTPRYIRFGWCGARMDDLMNWIPARITWLLIAFTAVLVPGCSARQAFVVGLRQHRVLPGPNSGWSEAATAGAIQRKLIGPIWAQDRLITDVWLGEAADPPAASHPDMVRAMVLVGTTGGLAALLALAGIALVA